MLPRSRLLLALVVVLLVAGGAVAWWMSERTVITLDSTVCRSGSGDPPDATGAFNVTDGQVVEIPSPPGAHDAVSYSANLTGGALATNVDLAGRHDENWRAKLGGCGRGGDDDAPPETVARLLIRGNGTLTYEAWG